MSTATDQINEDIDIVVSDLVEKYVEAKHSETQWKQAREKIEKLLLNVLGSREEGSETHAIGDHKITTTGKLTRTVDIDKWLEVRDELPPSYQNVVETPLQAKLSLPTLRAMQEHDKDAYGIFARCLTVKPAKTAIKVEAV